jgi:hypothetical protein
VIRISPALRGSLPIFRAAKQFGLWCAFAAFVIHELRATWFDKSTQALTMIQKWASILSVLIFISSSQFFAWYIGMLFPIALLTDRKTILADAVVGLSGAHMLSFTLLRRKALGYFFVATLIPIAWAVLVPSKRKVSARLSPAL